MLRVMSVRHAILLAGLLAGARPLCAAEPSSVALTRALEAVTAAGGDGPSEAQAMSRAITAARALTAAPAIPSVARDHAARGDGFSATAKTLTDFVQAATEFARAARIAPWVAEYHFQHARMAARAEMPAEAARAFGLYLEAAPRADDRAEVLQLVAALRVAADDAQKIVAATHPPGEVFRDCPDCPEVVAIPAGQFRMGSPSSEQGRFDAEGPQRTVAVRAFALSVLNITQAQFTIFLAETGYQPPPCNPLMGKSWRSPGRGLVYPPGFADLPQQPAVCLNWHDVQAYIDWLNRRVARFAPALKVTYRLPSEAEWEYAARGGTTTSRWWGEEVGINNANCQGCGSEWDNHLIAPGRSFGPNAFGLFDMLGNVWQWTADCWNESYSGAPGDGGAWLAGDCTRRVLRGGSWSNLPKFVRAAARNKADARGADFDFSSYAGFRIARSLN